MQAETADIGAALPDYELGERLGQGQFGVVWAARHRRLDRQVAVKQLTGSTVADPRNAERFRREARLLAQLDHRHVVRVYDYREADGLSLLVMERLTGGTFADRQSAGLGFESIIVAVVAAASGLHHLHLQGVLHRDVKPANLMFDGQHILKVTDFGTARGQHILDRESPDYLDSTGDVDEGITLDGRDATELSFAGEFMGTPGFAAPEQAASALGLAAEPVGPAADQYALAAVLYQALTGCYTHSIDGGTAALLTRRASVPARSAALANPAVPPRLSAVLGTALERRPSDRYGSIEEFAVAITAAAAAEWGPRWAERSAVGIAEPGRLWDAVHGAGDSPAAAPTTRSVKTQRRRWAAPKVLAIIVVAAVIIVVAALLLVIRDRSDRTAASAGSGQTSGAPANIPVAGSPTLLVDWRFPTGGNIFASPLVLDEVVVVGSMDGVVYGIDRALGTERWRLATGGPIRSSATVSGQLAVVGGDDGVLRAISFATGQQQWQAPVGYQIVSSPVVTQGLVMVGADKLYAFDAATGLSAWSAPTADVIISSPAVAGDLVVVGSNDGFLYGISAMDGTQKWKLATGGAVVAPPLVVDGVVFVGNRSGTMLAVDAATGTALWSRQVGGAVNGAAAHTADQIVVGTADGVVTALRRSDGSVLWDQTITGRIDSAPAVVGSTIVVGSSSGALHLLDAASGDLVGRLDTGGPILSSPRTADGQTFVGSYDNFLYRLHIAPN